MKCFVIVVGSSYRKSKCAASAALVGLAVFLAICSDRAHAQAFSTLLSFSGTNGESPLRKLALSGSTLYGITFQGGADNEGVIYGLPVTGGSATILASLNQSTGCLADSGPSFNGSTLYGMTEFWGPHGGGTIFSLPMSGGTPTVLLSFGGSNGTYPVGNVTLSGSTLYAAVSGGGTGYDGILIGMPVTGETATTLLTFSGTSGASLGSSPVGSLTLGGTTLYGTTLYGGTKNQGTVFKVNTDGSGFQSLLSFSGTNGINLGASPWCDLTLSGQVLYGTTEAGGTDNLGTVFKINTDGTGFRDLLNFNGGNGAAPHCSLAFSGSTLYGTTELGGANNDGSIFSLGTDGSHFTELFDFDGVDGEQPDELMLSGSTIYGVAQYGGLGYGGKAYSGDGTVYALTLNAMPEPSTLGLLAAGAACLAGLGLRRRRRLRREGHAIPCSQDDAPIMLSFSLRQGHRRNAVRRAA